MANEYSNFNEQLQNISRRQEFAKMLQERGQGAKLGNTQFAGGRAVPNKGGAELNAVLSQLLGAYQGKKANKDENRVKAEQKEEMAQWMLDVNEIQDRKDNPLEEIQIDTSQFNQDRVSPDVMNRIGELNQTAGANNAAEAASTENAMMQHLLAGQDVGGLAEKYSTSKFDEMMAPPSYSTMSAGSTLYDDRTGEPKFTSPRTIGGTGVTGSLQEINAINAERQTQGLPPLSTEEYLQTRRTNAANLQTYRQYVADASARGETPMSEAQFAAQRAEETAGAKTTGSGEAQRKLDLPSAWASRSSQTQNFTRLSDAITELDNRDNLWRAVGKGKYLTIAAIPGNEGKDITAAITNIKSQVGFMVLQDMRNNSKTGGALGQVSELENILLQENLAALDTNQSPEAFRKSLKTIQKYLKEAQFRLDNVWALEYPGIDEYGRPAEDNYSPPAAPASTATSQSGQTVERVAPDGVTYIYDAETGQNLGPKQ
jgi:hypothetical protein